MESVNRSPLRPPSGLALAVQPLREAAFVEERLFQSL